jgi:hypothetical protein
MKTGFELEHVAVRKSKKRDGSETWILYRPGNSSAVLDEFRTQADACLVAGFIEGHGGSYAADVRREVRRMMKMAEISEPSRCEYCGRVLLIEKHASDCLLVRGGGEEFMKQYPGGEE